MEKQNYIGRKVKGFSFENNKEYAGLIGYNKKMDKYIDREGIIEAVSDIHSYYVKFYDGETWRYPKKIVDDILIDGLSFEEEKLRDQFAMQAMNSLITVFKWKESEDIKALTDWAYIIADSMLKSRKEVK